MQLMVVCTGSQSGNCYILQNEKEALILDAGGKFKNILKAIDFKFENVVGCLVTHEHQDHLSAADDFKYMGIPFICNRSVWKKYGWMMAVDERKSFDIGGFAVTPFTVPHTTRDECGELVPCQNYAYIINHPEMGRFLYATDFEYIPVNLRAWNIRNMLIECNHMDDIEDKHNGKYAHVLKGHSSLNTVKEFVRVNKTGRLKNIVLCHLSAENADEGRMLNEVQDVAGVDACVHIAKPTMEPLNLDICPF